jgi:hypothetical protein
MKFVSQISLVVLAELQKWGRVPSNKSSKDCVFPRIPHLLSASIMPTMQPCTK